MYQPTCLQHHSYKITVFDTTINAHVLKSFKLLAGLQLEAAPVNHLQSCSCIYVSDILHHPMLCVFRRGAYWLARGHRTGCIGHHRRAYCRLSCIISCPVPSLSLFCLPPLELCLYEFVQLYSRFLNSSGHQ